MFVPVSFIPNIGHFIYGKKVFSSHVDKKYQKNAKGKNKFLPNF
jgi:hypothetical protein